MTSNFTRFALAGLMTLGLGSAGESVTAADGSGLLQTLERGLWQLRATGGGSGAAASQLCLGDPKMLAQIQHGSANCTHTLVESSANAVTISYSCNGTGQGLTTIRKETGRLVQIKSQGIRNGAPFSFSVEGRRAGTC